MLLGSWRFPLNERASASAQLAFRIRTAAPPAPSGNTAGATAFLGGAAGRSVDFLDAVALEARIDRISQDLTWCIFDVNCVIPGKADRR